MDVDVVVYVFALLQSASVLFLVIYFFTQIVTLSDLECDYINARACCARLNRWVKPELGATVFLTIVLLVTAHFYLCTFTLPISAWLLYRYMRIPAGSIGIYDATEIHNRNLLKSHLKETLAKLTYHLLSFFIYLICMIVSLASGTGSERAMDSLDPEYHLPPVML